MKNVKQKPHKGVRAILNGGSTKGHSIWLGYYKNLNQRNQIKIENTIKYSEYSGWKFLDTFSGEYF